MIIDTSRKPKQSTRRFLMIADMPEFEVTDGVAYYVSDDLMTVIAGDDSRRAFVDDCVRRLLSGDYGVVAGEIDSWNQDVKSRGIGTVYGVYGTDFDTGDGVNQFWVGHFHDIEESGKRFTHLPVVYLPREH